MIVMSLNINLLHSLPYDIIINHIIPYTYMIKPSKHLHDIRSYTLDYNTIDNYYLFEYNYYVLMNDFALFCNNQRNLIIGINIYFFNIIKRNFMLQNKLDNEIYLYIDNNFHNNVFKNVERKIKLLWGLFRPKERTHFINEFIIKNMYMNMDIN